MVEPLLLELEVAVSPDNKAGATPVALSNAMENQAIYFPFGKKDVICEVIVIVLQASRSCYTPGILLASLLPV